MDDFIDNFEEFEIVEDSNNEDMGQVKLTLLNPFFYDNDLVVVFDSQFSLFFKGWYQNFSADETGFNHLVKATEGILFGRYKALNIYNKNGHIKSLLIPSYSNSEVEDNLPDDSHYAIANHWIAAKNRKYQYASNGKIMEGKDEGVPVTDLIMMQDVVKSLISESEKAKFAATVDDFERGKAEGLRLAIDKIHEAYLLRHLEGVKKEGN